MRAAAAGRALRVSVRLCGCGLSPAEGVRDPDRSARGAACGSCSSRWLPAPGSPRRRYLWGYRRAVRRWLFLYRPRRCWYSEGFGSFGLNLLVQLGTLKPTLNRQWGWGGCPNVNPSGSSTPVPTHCFIPLVLTPHFCFHTFAFPLQPLLSGFFASLEMCLGCSRV